ncbi:MAG: alpha/beta hydrolase [Rhodospirillales bacterium]|nr:alpha/beta hydrolase [Rhodospirillales bacterium]
MATATRLSLTILLISTLMGACATPRIQPSGNETVTPMLHDDHFIAEDTSRLPVRVWKPEATRPKAVLIALHGFNDYSNFFSETGDFLARRDVVTYAYDQRGFGEAPEPGLWHGIPAMSKDLRTFTALIRNRHPDTPLYLFGESMGGAVIMVTVSEARTHGLALDVDGVILSAPAVWGRKTMPWYQTLALWISAHTFPGVKLTGKGLKIMASDNIEMLRALGRDPLIIKATRIDAMYGLTNLMDSALNSATNLELPLLMLYGKKDEVIPKEPTNLMLSRLPDAAKSARRVIFYDNGYHMLTRDLQAETVWRDIAQWITTRNSTPTRQSATGN